MFSSAPAVEGAPSTGELAAPGAPPVLQLDDVCKCYRLYERPEDRLKQMLWRARRRYYREFWALSPVSLTVSRGEAMGVIGRNGSGKSTLLQLIAGTLRPTAGGVQVNGRLFALLELGAGFNPEFTGRENAALSGAILGVSRAEMQERFPAIVDFAALGEFIDHPVKTYSTGMYARLAFAVATALEPDILLVDEMLAVGDVAFQQKCISRLREMRERGLTLLLVSHSVDAVKSVCGRAILLDGGRMVASGSADEVTDEYLTRLREEMNTRTVQELALPTRGNGRAPTLEGKRRYGTGHVQLEHVTLESDDGRPAQVFRFGERITLRVAYRAQIEVDQLSVAFLVRDATGVDLLGTTTFEEEVHLPALAAGAADTVRIRFQNRLRPGSYGVSVAINRVSRRDLTDNVLFDQIDAVVAFEVIGDPRRPVHYKFHEPVEIVHG